MAITYVNDLRLSEMGTGDNSGTWGTVTNTNLELIGEALGFGTEAITTNADTHASTMADGSTDPVRAMYVKYTGTLDSACTITIGPNTVNKFYYIENATSGSQNIIISQGSGANVTIPAGDVKAVYLDGAGSGAAVTDAFASLNVVDLKVQDDLTVTDDMTVGGTLGVTGVLTATSLDISGDIDVDGTTNLDVVDIDGAVDMASTLQVDGAITSNGLLTVDGSANSSQAIFTGTSGRGLEISTFSVGAADEGVKLDATASGSTGQIALATNGTNRVVLDGNGDVLFGNGNGHSPKIQGTTNSGRTEGSPGYSFNDDLNTGMFQPLSAADTIAFSTGGTEAARFDSSRRLLIGSTASQENNHRLQITGGDQATSSISVSRLSADQYGAHIEYLGTRSTSVGSNTIVQNNDTLGLFIFRGDDGTDFATEAASIAGEVGGTPGSNDMPGRLIFKTTADGAATGTERMRISNDGTVVINNGGTGNQKTLALKGTGTGSNFAATSNSGAAFILTNLHASDNSFNIIDGMNSNNLVTSRIAMINTSISSRTGDIAFMTHDGSSLPEAMRITSAQDVLVGKTSVAFGSAGIELKASASFNCTRAGTTTNFNRISSDGAVSEFYKDGAVVGSIGVNGGDLYVVNAGGVGAGLKYNSGFPNILPCNNTGDGRDNAIDIGASGIRFDDIFATNGTIQTSDRNEKQDIAALTSTEMLVAKRISSLFKTFRWKDKVASKGDNARTHSGIIAQDVQAAFAAESLDAGDYSMFISGSWWEHDVDVAAVEADDTVEPAIESADAYTRTDIYDTEDEAPSGSTKKTRLGIRYPELLSFLAAYNEQRFAAIETRLTALEG